MATDKQPMTAISYGEEITADRASPVKLHENHVTVCVSTKRIIRAAVKLATVLFKSSLYQISRLAPRTIVYIFTISYVVFYDIALVFDLLYKTRRVKYVSQQIYY